MIHPSLRLEYLKNKKFKYSSLDSFSKCVNKIHFIKYKKKIHYSYNSRRFRDVEWPREDKLSSCIWCVGESFTVGIGQPYEKIWSSLLELYMGNTTINVSMSGGSNDWMRRKINYITKNISPKYIVVQWSYISRREKMDCTLLDNERRERGGIEDGQNDAINIINNIVGVEKNRNNTKIIHTFIPLWSWSAPILNNNLFWKLIIKERNLENISIVLDTTQLDYARDYNHYDTKTATKYVEHIVKLF